MVEKKITAFNVLILLICFSACGNKTNSKDNLWADTTWTQLTGESIKFRKPNEFKISSRYRIKEDLPKIDDSKIALLQTALEGLELQDAQLDVFVDTTSNYRFVIICNVEPIRFTKSDATILKKDIERQNALKDNIDLYTEYGELDAKINQGNNLIMAQFTTPIKNLVDNSIAYNTIYYLTGSSYSLVVFEMSDDTDRIEDYLWTTKTD